MLLERDIALSESLRIDLRSFGTNVTFLTIGNGSNPSLPLDYALLGPDGLEWTRFAVDRFTHAPTRPFVWQWLPEDASKFVLANYLWIWPLGSKKKIFTFRFRNTEPHVVEMQSGYPGLRHSVSVEGEILVVRARAEGLD